jgi:hypothetical protein
MLASSSAVGSWKEVQIPYFEVQIADFSSLPPHVGMVPSTRGGTMTAPTTMQIAGFHVDVIAPDHDGDDEARAVRNGTVDFLVHANQNIAPAKRR